ncbi:cobalt-precorrin-6A reductase [Phyllobacterium sp. 628]|uniref:cobalt-precorrin-6A reductase n=1 Tax=Phyllobacterium sp. 628 TaxID=2718938 RepID=UPI0016626FB2|nr:cobalt-precorrin-6A reductase [Phyllobacterium sp. 628]QND53523.1 cobalt-precorrin-6A reductase [Phyllobacterium sp. 628]
MPVSDRRVLILGGTAEATKLAASLVAQGYSTISSLAGRTRDPAKIEGAVRTGGFGGAEGLAHYLLHENIALLVDATHPFATQISDNALAAVQSTHTPFVRLERPAWQRKPGDIWNSVATLEEAVLSIPSRARVLLALGRQHIGPFSKRRDVYFVVRMIDPPETPPDLADFELELSKPGKKDEEAAFLTRKRLTHIVCRNSGGSASYAKIAAARELGLPVIMIERPHRPDTSTLPDVDSIISFVRERLG